MSFVTRQLEVTGVASVLHIFTLGREGGRLTQSGEHYSDARGRLDRAR